MEGADASDPRVWFAGLLRSIVGVRRGDNTAAGAYLRFVEQHRGRPAAIIAGREVQSLARTGAFANAHIQLHKLEHPDAYKVAPPVAIVKPRPRKRC